MVATASVRLVRMQQSTVLLLILPSFLLGRCTFVGKQSGKSEDAIIRVAEPAKPQMNRRSVSPEEECGKSPPEVA